MVDHCRPAPEVLCLCERDPTSKSEAGVENSGSAAPTSRGLSSSGSLLTLVELVNAKMAQEIKRLISQNSVSQYENWQIKNVDASTVGPSQRHLLLCGGENKVGL